MLKRGIFTRFEQFRQRDEEGVALVSVVILSMVILIIVSSLSITLVQGANLTADNKSQVVTFASAESGTDYALLGAVANSCETSGSSAADGFTFEVYRSASETAPTGLSDPTLSKGCPQHGDKFITIKSTGTDSRGKATEVVSTFRWVIRNLGSAEGAVVAGTGLSNISQLGVYNTDGDLLVKNGNFDCNSSSNISGDVVIMNGTFRMSGGCEIKGSVYAKGNVQIDNAAVSVGGDVYTLGDFYMTTAATVKGSVYAKGNIKVDSNALIEGTITGLGTGQTLIDHARILGGVFTNGPLRIGSDARIEGSVISTNSGSSDIYAARINGDLLINGRFSQFAASVIGGNVSAAAAGQTNAIEPSGTFGGFIRLGGTSNSSTPPFKPSPLGGLYENQTISARVPVTFEVPVQLTPDFFKWRDFSYLESDWTSAGYQVVAINNCDFQNVGTNVAKINSYTVPTLVDARGCSNFNAYGVTFNLKTNVTFLVNKLDNGQAMKINSASGTGKHEFNIIAPDLVKDSNPTCSSGQGDIRVPNLMMSDDITGFIYSPCKVSFGGASKINGQIYTGNADYAAGGLTAFKYVKMGIPGFPVEAAGETPAAFDADATERVLPVLVARSEN